MIDTHRVIYLLWNTPLSRPHSMPICANPSFLAFSTQTQDYYFRSEKEEAQAVTRRQIAKTPWKNGDRPLHTSQIERFSV